MSLAARVIPCLDVTDGRVVKGVNFVDLRDAGDPVELGLTYDREGADELVFLDITASSDGRETMVETVARVADTVSIPFAVGGGLRTVDDAHRMLHAGADKVAFNTAGVRDPELFTRAAAAFGSQSVVAAVDARRHDPDDPTAGWDTVIHGGRTPVGRDAVVWCAEVAERGAGEILLTSMDRDGTKAGFDLELLRAVGEVVDVPVIASGGAGTADHMAEGILQGGASAVLAASIFHFGELRIRDVKARMAARGVVVRQVPRTGVSGVHELDRLAVYGTLVPGGVNAEVLADLPGEWTRGTVVGTHYEDGWHGYPGLVLAEDANAAGAGRAERVPVHLLRSPALPRHLQRLDAFEGPGYRRVVATVQLEDGAHVDAWIYALVDPPQ